MSLVGAVDPVCFFGVAGCSAELGGTTPPADLAMLNEKDRNSSVPPDELRSRSFVRICVYRDIADPALSERFAISRQTRRLCGSATGSCSFVSTTYVAGQLGRALRTGLRGLLQQCCRHRSEGFKKKFAIEMEDGERGVRRIFLPTRAFRDTVCCVEIVGGEKL